MKQITENKAVVLCQALDQEMRPASLLRFTHSTTTACNRRGKVLTMNALSFKVDLICQINVLDLNMAED